MQHTTNIFRGNDSLNPLGYISLDPTVGASPWTYTNNDSVDEVFQFRASGGATFSSINKGEQSFSTPSSTESGVIYLMAGEALVITYAIGGGTVTAKRWGL